MGKHGDPEGHREQDDKSRPVPLAVLHTAILFDRVGEAFLKLLIFPF
jgi:hypothetical protein